MKTHYVLVLCVLLALGLSSCAAGSYRFIHDTKTQEDYERDKYECGLVTQAQTNASPYRGNPFIIGPMAAANFRDCMRYRYGWRRIPCQRGELGCELYYE